MAQYIDKSASVAEIERRYGINLIGAHSALKELADKIKEELGENASIEALTLVVKADDGWVHSYNYESGCVHEIGGY